MVQQVTSDVLADGSVSTAELADSAVTTVKIADSGVTTVKLAANAVTPAKLSQPLTQGTAAASTSGTSIDFTGIPSWVKRITVMLNGVSTSGSAAVGVQIGAGSIDATGYNGAAGGATTGSTGVTNWSTIATTNDSSTAAATRYGTFALTNMGSNIWTIVGNIGQTDTARVCWGFGAKTLSGTLDRVRITTANGTDTFDAGSINILYE